MWGCVLGDESAVSVDTFLARLRRYFRIDLPSSVLFWMSNYYSFGLSLAVFENLVEVNTAGPGTLMSV